MCGIIGGFSSFASEAAIQEGLASIRHRGPDSEGVFQHQDFFTAACRLAIRDPGLQGTQPMLSPDGRFVLCYNGELYNQTELRRQLLSLGFSFRTETDTETLLCAWQAWGVDCLLKLSGTYAFAIYDSREETLFLARDPLGVKPLYVYNDDKSFLFTSEVKGLLHWPGLHLGIKEELLFYNLMFLYLPGEQTLFQHIRKLAPGHFGIYKRKENSYCEQRFYQLPFTGSYHSDVSEKEWADHLETRLLTAIRTQIPEEVNAGIALSGGLDSSLLAAMLQRMKGGGKIPVFSIGGTAGMAQEGFGNDLSFARKVAGSLQLDLEIVPGALQLENELDRMVWHLESPQGDPAAIHQLHLAEAAAAKGLKVLFSGAGADDVFAGYRRHQALRWLFLKQAPAALKTILEQIAGLTGAANKRRMRKLLKDAGGGTEEQMFSSFFWLEQEAAKKLFVPLVQNKVAALDPFLFLRATLAEIPKEKSRLNQMLALDLRLFMGSHNLNYLDKLCMAAGVEGRVPFLDESLIAFSATMPPQLKLKGSTTKYLLKKVAERYLPKEIIYRKKTGFAAPIRSLIKGPLSTFVLERLLEGSLRQKNIFDEKEIKQLIDANASGQLDAAYPIFTLLTIESWLRQFTAA